MRLCVFSLCCAVRPSLAQTPPMLTILLLQQQNSLIATAEAYAEKPYDRRLAKVIRQRQYRDTQSRAQRRRKEKEDQEWADYEATHGPLPPIPGPAFGPSSGAQRALAMARRSGGGHRAGLRYFGWQY